MTDSSGIDRDTGAVLTDWAQVEQSIRVILTTRIGSRIMRRDFGSILPDLIDRKMTPATVLAVYAACAIAIHAWEPRYRVTSARLVDATATGVAAVELSGTYYPRGHLGDYSIMADATVRVLARGSA